MNLRAAVAAVQDSTPYSCASYMYFSSFTGFFGVLFDTYDKRWQCRT